MRFKLIFLFLPLFISRLIASENAVQALQPEPIYNDCIFPDAEEIARRKQQLHVSDYSAMAIPSGAGVYDTSAYMVGSVAVGIILVESTGNGENWDSTRESAVISEIQNGLAWLAERDTRANLSFVYEIHYGRTETNAQTTREPITLSTQFESLWINEIMLKFGYHQANYLDKVFYYDNALRVKYNTDWAFMIFVVDSKNDADGEFSNDTFAYSHLGGPFLVMTYDNASYGITHMDSVVAHEACHIFWALDEYATASSVNEYSGYLNVQNGNHATGGAGYACVMKASYIENVDMCSFTRGQVGLADSNSNDILDPIDAPPETTLMNNVSNPANSTTAFNGSANVNVVKNNNPQPVSTGNDITVNTILNVQYRVDGGSWQNASPVDGANDSATENFLFILTNLRDGPHIIEARAIDSAGGNDVSPARNDLTVLAGSQTPTPLPSPVTTYIKVGPNPCKVSSDDTTVNFTNLPNKARISIYTINGELVFTSPEAESTQYQWNLLNSRNNKIATEMYIYVIKTGAKTVKTGKLLVIR